MLTIRWNKSRFFANHASICIDRERASLPLAPCPACCEYCGCWEPATRALAVVCEVCCSRGVLNELVALAALMLPLSRLFFLSRSERSTVAAARILRQRARAASFEVGGVGVLTLAARAWPAFCGDSGVPTSSALIRARSLVTKPPKPALVFLHRFKRNSALDITVCDLLHAISYLREEIRNHSYRISCC